MWQFTADTYAQSLEFTRLRTGELHLNALPFLEPPALVNLTLDSVHFFGDVLEADIGLRHPFLGLKQFTGFDVRGIFIGNGTVSGFEDADLVTAGADDTRMLNSDGYTRWWNPSEFPVNEGTMFSYNDGLLGTPYLTGGFNCTLNGYKYYCDELDADEPLENVEPAGRGVFSVGQKNVRKYVIEMNDGLVFNYAVDASWAMPSGDPPYDVPDDFASAANCPEAWRVSVTEAENTLYNDGDESGGGLSLSIDVYDWFDADLNTVKVESAGNFDSVMALSASGGGVGFSTYEIEITDASPAPVEIELLITVECESVGYGGLLPGKAVAHYSFYTASVDDEKPYTEPHSGWAVNWGGLADRGMAVCVDAEGSSYSTGWFENDFSNPIDFDPGAGVEEHASNGHRDAYLSKFNTKGEFQWALTWGGGSDDEGHGVCVDGDSIYVTGFFKGTVDLDPTGGVDSHAATGSEDAFLIKINSDGAFQWAESWGGNCYNSVTYHYQNHPYFGDCGFGVDTDESGNAYVAGTGYDGQGRSFVRKYGSAGNLQWEKVWGASDFDKAFDIAVYESNTVYVVGRMDGTVDFDPGAGVDNLTAHDAHDSYIAKYDASGNYQWARNWGGADKHTGYSDPTTHYSDGAYGVAVDSSGNAYITGEYYGTVDFDPGPGVDNHPNLSPYGYGDAYLTVFEPGGDFVWARTWGGQHFQKGYGIDVDPASGTIYIAGRYYYTVDFDPGSDVESHTSAGDADAYISKFDTSGDFHWVRVYGSSLYEAGTDVAVDGDENAYLTGYFRGAIDFDPGLDDCTLTNYIQEDIFLTKLLPNGYWEE